MPGRKFGNDSRYGFNGKERDKDMHGLTAYDYGFRIYNPAIGRFLSVDPLTASYPFYTPYQFAGNKPTRFIDLDGKEEAEPAEFLKALYLILDFMNKTTTTSAWPNIKKETFVSQIFSTITNKGYNIDQGSPTWLCGVAAPAHLFASRNPTAYVEKMITLYEKGYFPATINVFGNQFSGEIKASPGLKDVSINELGNNPESEMRAVDYMLLGTIRHRVNDFKNCNPDLPDRKGNYNNCGTWPTEMALIMDIFDLRLTTDTYWKDEKPATYVKIKKAMELNKGVILFVNPYFGENNASKKGDGSITDVYGIHYVVLKSFSITYNSDGSIKRIKGSYWDYGQTDNSKFKTFDHTKEDFENTNKGVFITEN